MTRLTRRHLPPWLVALVGLSFAVVLSASSLSSFDWNPTLFVGFGEDAHSTTNYAEQRLDYEVMMRPEQGHDGKFFFVQANDPWILDPDENASNLDHPTYRSQRMFYPLLAGGFGILGPEAVVWGLLVVNILAMGVGTFATATLADRLGGSALWGLAFTLNLGLFYSLTSDTAEIVAAALAMGAVALLYQKRELAGIGLLALASVTREAMIVCAVGAAIWLWTERRRRDAALAIGIPGLALASWLLFLRFRLGPQGPGPDALSAPFVGLIRAIPEWMDDSLVLATGLAVILLTIVFVVRWARSRTLLGWAFIGFVPLAVVLSKQVWTEIFDFTRALSPLLTAAVLLVFVESRVARKAALASPDQVSSGFGS